jgi:hypothetical protein
MAAKTRAIGIGTVVLVLAGAAYGYNLAFGGRVGAACTKSGDCRMFYSCLEGDGAAYCTKACKTDGDCPTGWICDIAQVTTIGRAGYSRHNGSFCARSEKRAAPAPAAATQKKAMACPKSDDISISGIGEDVTVTGECGSVAISGSENKVTIEATGRIEVSGIQNVVRWQRGLGGKPPKIQKSGVDHKVERMP